MIELTKDGTKAYAVSSGVGTGELSMSPVMSFEVKCPKPGKLFATDVYYKIPRYYVAQILAEMK